MSEYDGMDGNFTSTLQRLIAASGGQISIGSGFRSPERQAQLFAEAVKKYGSPEKARRYVAPPGKSNHNKGVAADLKFNTPEARKLAHQLAPQFGLVFPMDYEPWHIEPVGARDKAHSEAYPLPVNGYMHPHDPNYSVNRPQLQAAQMSAAMTGFTEQQQNAIEGKPITGPNFEGGQEDTDQAGQPVAAPAGPAGSDTVSRFLASIKKHESGGNYTAKNPHASASGAYQFIDKTWNNYGGYAHAWQAPPEVQDAKAREFISGAPGGPREWSAIWYLGHVPKSQAEWDSVPHPEAGNRMTPSAYANWIENDMRGGMTSKARSMAINDVATEYPAFAQFAAIPELQALWYQAGVEHWTQDQFQQQLWATQWWKSNSAASRNATQQLADPAEWNKNYIRALQMVQNIGAQEGIGQTPAQQDLYAKYALQFGWDETLTRQYMIKDAPAGTRNLRGDLDATWSKIRGVAADYGLNMSDQWMYEQAQKVQGSGMTLDGVTEYMKEAARAQYRHLDKQISEGFTVRQIAEPYVQAAAQLLEINPNSISLTDPKWQRALNAQDDKGQPRLMTTTEWQKTLMQDPGYGWDQTSNAKQTAYNLTDQLAQTLGVRA